MLYSSEKFAYPDIKYRFAQKSFMGSETIKNTTSFILSLYLFLLSIKLLSTGLKLLGKTGEQMIGGDILSTLISSTADPLTGLFVGIFVTSIIQSSSATTCLVVGMVSANPAFLPYAVPIVMGANIGTTVTNTLVSFGHVVRKKEFAKALSGATLHDFFNLTAVLIILPIELLFHPLQKTALYLAQTFNGAGGFEFISPLKIILDPIIKTIMTSTQSFGAFQGIGIAFIAFVILMLSLKTIVQSMRKLALRAEENAISKYLFKNSFTAFTVGLFVTALVQSSSVTTSMIVPFIGAGMLSLEQALPYMMGANIGTTITSLLAALGGATAESAVAVQGQLSPDVAALTIAFVHTLFNILAVCIIYPLRVIPVTIAKKFGSFASQKKRYAIAYIITLFYIIPIIYIILTGTMGG